MTKKRKIKDGKCRCGNPVPGVKDTETPYEFCSMECKKMAAEHKGPWAWLKPKEES